MTKPVKAARSTCSKCHMIYDRNTMVQVETTVRSGHSNGGGVSFGRKRKMKNGSFTRNTRVSLGRRHYHRKKKVWVCSNCTTVKPAKGILRKLFGFTFKLTGHLILTFLTLGIWPVWLLKRKFSR